MAALNELNRWAPSSYLLADKLLIDHQSAHSIQTILEMTGEVGIITPDLCSKLPLFEERWKVREDAEEMKPAAVTAWERASQPVLDRLKGSEVI
jgi:hypothetical protein